MTHRDPEGSDTTARALAEAALEMGHEVAARSGRELGVLMDGDACAVLAASQIVRLTDVGLPSAGRTAQHIAFALLSALYSAATVRP